MRQTLALVLSVGLLVLSGCAQSKAPAGIEAPKATQVQTYTIEATDHSFGPALITVPIGTSVTINLVNRGKEKHEWELEGYDVEIKAIPPGATGVITLVADKAGTFRFICDIDDHYEKGMRGFLIVTDSKG